ncbi:MAG TPA: Rpn family recombination-promoting nuclease/putative transposase [Tepidimicrobium sp.]|nr:Rpn family recombination-promoting nuclease/putative transposase [Tepidimicrobium sp.]
MYSLIDTILIYYSSANKNLTEEDIIRKIQELDGKGEKIMTILQAREQKGIAKGIEQGIAKGIEQGINQGRIEERKVMAKKLISMGMSIEQIMEVTNLTRKEIEEIEEKTQN